MSSPSMVFGVHPKLELDRYVAPGSTEFYREDDGWIEYKLMEVSGNDVKV